MLIGAENPVDATANHEGDFDFDKRDYAEMLAGVYSAYGYNINVLDLLLCI